MKFTILSGSQRQNSNSLKVSELVQDYIHSQWQGSETQLLNMAANPLPFWDDSAWAAQSHLASLWAPYAAQLAASDGLIIVAPEWHGMVPAAVKNFFLYCGNSTLAHKPGLIIAVSAGMGGSAVISELRLSSYKNSRLCYVPDHVILRRVEDFLSAYTDPKDPIMQQMQKHLHYSLEVFRHYALALQTVRASGVIDLKTFPNGL